MGRPANWRETLTPCDAKRRGAKAPTPKERGEGGDRCDCYWLYIVTDCDATPRPQIIKDPVSLPWHEACLPCHHASRRRQVKKVDHYWVSVDAVRDPRKVHEEPS